jgi:CheY-like chemotaxis protein
MKNSKNAHVKQGRIVVVEEMPDNIYSIRFILESLGYNVGSVSCRKGYLEEIERMGPKLIVVDMLIPAGGGLRAISDLRGSGLRDVPAIAITADAVAIDEAVLRKKGFEDVLHKPYTVTQLQEKLGKFVG